MASTRSTPKADAPNTRWNVERLATRILMTAAGLLVLLWFGREVVDALLLIFFAVVLSIVLSAPVTWLEQRGASRWLATLAVFAGVLAILGVIGWLVIPQLAKQISGLVESLPKYASRLSGILSQLLTDFPELQHSVSSDLEDPSNWLPSFPTLATRIGHYSMPVLTFAAITLVLFAIVMYAVARPRPLLVLYVRAFLQARRETAARAFARASTMVVGWIWSNIVVGTIEAVLAGLFLAYMSVPGALVWASLAFFAELVPKVGPYIMATPPVLVALADSPMTAVWVAGFYIAMNEIMGDFVTPRVRASTMEIHPASTLIVMLVMASAFGIPGALIATPMAAFIKAYYEEFYLAGRSCPDASLVEGMLKREVPAGDPP